MQKNCSINTNTTYETNSDSLNREINEHVLWKKHTQKSLNE